MNRRLLLYITVACGVFLFSGDAALDVDAIMHRRAPRPLVTLPAADFDATAVEEVIVVFKQQYDIGFWGQCKGVFIRPVTARTMVETFRTFPIDSALETCDKTKDSPLGHRFIWTVPGWPMAQMAANDQNPERLECVVDATRRGLLASSRRPRPKKKASGSGRLLLTKNFNSQPERRLKCPLYVEG